MNIKSLIKSSLLFLLIISCSVKSKEEIERINKNFKKRLIPLVIEKYELLDDKKVIVTFSREIEFKNAFFENKSLEIESIKQKSNKLEFLLSSKVKIANEYILNIIVYDKNKNSYNFLISIKKENENIPDIKINEVELYYYKDKKTKEYKRVETVELKIMSSGDLNGVTFFYSSRNLFDILYTFPSIKVNKKNYILLETRENNIKYKDPNIIKINVVKNNKYKGLSKSSGVIMISKDKSINNIIDSLVYVNLKKSKHFEKKKNLIKLLNILVKKGAWNLGDNKKVNPKVIFDSSYSSSTRSVSRKEQDNGYLSKDNWYITDIKGITLGHKNSNKIFNPN